VAGEGLDVHLYILTLVYIFMSITHCKIPNKDDFSKKKYHWLIGAEGNLGFLSDSKKVE